MTHFTKAVQERPRQRRVQDLARARDAERRAGPHQPGARARVEGSARRRAAGISQGARHGRDQPAGRVAAPRSSNGPSATGSRRAGRSRRSTRCASRPARQAQPLLNPANREPLRITFNNSSLRDVLTTLGELSGISVQFDRQFFTDAPVTVRLDGVTIEQALQQVLSANGHFYKVLNQNTIIVAQDNAAGAREVRRAGRPGVLPVALGPDRDLADHQHGHAHPDRGAAGDVPEQDREHADRPRRPRRWSM